MARVVFSDLNSGMSALPELGEWALEAVPADLLQQAVAEQAAPVLLLRSGGDDSAALELLRQLGALAPDMVRIHLCCDSSAKYVAQSGEIAEYSLSAHTDDERILFAIERAVKVRKRLNDPQLQELVRGGAQPPELPPQVVGINELIDQQVPETKTSVASLFRGCPELLKGVMKLLNLPFFGFEKHLFSIDEAVHLVGLRTVRDLTLLVHLDQWAQQPQGWEAFQFEHHTARALETARLAQKIARDALADRITQSAAYMSGLLHDFGMRLLVIADPQRYYRVMEKAVELDQPIYGVEKLEYGTTHADISAWLLSQLGASPRVVRSVLYHHYPKAARDGSFTTLTALHVADALLPSLPNALNCNLGGKLALDYLDRIGLSDKRVRWQSMAEDQGVQLTSYW